MKEITAEHVTSLYVPRVEGAPEPGEVGRPIEGLGPFMRDRLNDADDFRLVLIPSVPHFDVLHAYFLHWDDGRNLDDLDQKVEQNTYTDQDFLHSAKARHERTRCTHCGHVWNTLVMPTGDPYLGAPRLEQLKIKQHRIVRCPHCGSSLRQLVVKVFGAAE